MQQNMEYILTIYETGSIRKAAERLHITQPALSISLRKMEEELGTPLFDRSTHPLELTPAGKIFVSGLSWIRQIEKSMRTAVLDLSRLNTGTLRVGGTQYFTSCVLPPVIRRYTQLYPCVELYLSEADTALNTQKLLGGQLDLLLSTRDFDPEKFDLFPVSHDHLLLCVPLSLLEGSGLKKWEITRGDILSRRYLSMEPLQEPGLLSGLPFILLQEGSELHKRSMKFFQEAGVSPKTAVRVEQLVTAYRLSCCQVGASFVTDALIRQSADAAVRYFRISPLFTLRSYRIVTQKHHYLSNAAQKFIALCCEEHDPHPEENENFDSEIYV